jgi:predicted GNAT family N-acyltransferase
MQSTGSYVVRRVDWESGQRALRAVREAVFVREQAVPPVLEWDEYDSVSRHVVAEAGGVPIGAGRLLPDGHIGRMAVLAPWRGRGVGSALLRALLQLAEEAGHPRVMLSAQVHAQGFYHRFGFASQGQPYLEAGIEHVAMARALDPVTRPAPQR